MKEKSEILSKLKEIKNDIRNEEFPRLRAEYMKVHNKIRYTTDEEHRRNKIEHIKIYQETYRKALSGALIAVEIVFIFFDFLRDV